MNGNQPQSTPAQATVEDEEKVSYLLALLTSDDTQLRLDAANAIAAHPGQATTRGLLGLLGQHPDPVVRYDAAYALAELGDPEVLPELLDVAGDLAEIDRVRGQAIEAIGVLLAGTDRRKKIFKEAADHLIALLDDPWPEVRFWCCYSLGVMRANQATPILQRLAATDDEKAAKGFGWPTVGDEAQAAITAIEEGTFPVPEN